MTELFWQPPGNHLAVDFINTSCARGGQRTDMIGTVERFCAWTGARSFRLPEVRQEEIVLKQVLDQRDVSSRLLSAAVAAHPMDRADVALISVRLSQGRTTRVLLDEADDGRTTAQRGQATLLGVLAGAIVELLARDDLAAVAQCHAPGCGQFFHRSRRNQRWCTSGCGNRARVYRHRLRNLGFRGGRSQLEG